VHILAVRKAAIALMSLCLMTSKGFAGMSAELNTKEFNSVKFHTDNVIYEEALLDGRWVLTSWQVGAEKTTFCNPKPAFQLSVKPDPHNTIQDGYSQGWQWVSFNEVPSRGQTKEYVVELRSTIEPAILKIHTLLDDTAVITRWLEFTQHTGRPLGITELAVWSGSLWEHNPAVRWGHSIRWHVPWEGWFGWERLKPGRNTYLNDKGLVWDDPYFILHNEDKGEYFFGHLAWPQNFIYTIDNDDDGISFQMGPWAINELRVLDSGETVSSPPMHLGYTKGDFDEAVQAMHEHARRSVILKPPAGKEYRIECLAPEDRQGIFKGDNYNEDNVKEMVSVAAAAGMELFIVDGPTWAKGYGNWIAKETWFPNGLEPIRQHAHSKGVLFGLYAEPEGGRGDWTRSRGYQDPQLRIWFIRCNPDYPTDCFLNISKPEAAKYMEDEFAGVIDRYHLDLYRHDQNGCFGGDGSVTRRAGYIENDYWRYYDNLHGILKRIHARYPDMLLQQASGGGSRLEYATAAHWNEHFTSDRAWYPEVYRMAAGLSVYLPPEILVTPNGMCNKDGWPDLITAIRSAYGLGNTPMFFNMILPERMEEFEKDDLEDFQRYAKLYKEFIRPTLGQAKVYHHAPVNATGGVEDGDWLAMEFASPAKDKGWATIVRLNGNQGAADYQLRLKGIDVNQSYLITLDNDQKTETISGEELMIEGLEIALSNGQYSEFVTFIVE